VLEGEKGRVWVNLIHCCLDDEIVSLFVDESQRESGLGLVFREVFVCLGGDFGNRVADVTDYLKDSVNVRELLYLWR
jgi:hypothetical protein